MLPPPLDYQSRRHSKIALGWLDLAAGVLLLLPIIWFVILAVADHAGAQYSNRVFAPPALLASLIVSIYGFCRLKSVPLLPRLICFPVTLILGYGSIGLGMILLNASF